jgi:hypothetical protein
MTPLKSSKLSDTTKETVQEIDVEALNRLGEAHRSLRKEIEKVIIGQGRIIDDLLTAIFARDHCPGYRSGIQSNPVHTRSYAR